MENQDLKTKMIFGSTIKKHFWIKQIKNEKCIWDKPPWGGGTRVLSLWAILWVGFAAPVVGAAEVGAPEVEAPGMEAPVVYPST